MDSPQASDAAFIVTASTCAIGIDVGGTKLAAGVVEFPEGKILARRLQATAPERGGEAVLLDVLALAGSLRAEAIQLAKSPIAIGLAVAELVSRAGEIVSDATIRWKGLPVRERLQKILPTRIEADVRAAALAEARFGIGRSFQDFIFVTVGTGISSCLVLGGQPFPGARGLTGTMASSPSVVADLQGSLVIGPPLENVASGPALVARLKRMQPDFTGGAPEVLALAEDGDKTARIIVESAGRALGAAIGQLVNTLDPEAVVIGGGLGLAGGLFWQTLEVATREHIWSPLHRNLRVLPAQSGVDAGWLGAALAAAEIAAAD